MATAYVLASFAYLAKADVPHLVRRARDMYGVDVDFFADSGAFTAHSSGKVITVKQYAAWLAVHGHVINCAATLDVIGDPAATARNTEALRDAVGDQVYIIPIFHVGSPWAELEAMCAAHPYVGLGGGVGVGQRESAFMAWLVKAHRIARDNGAVFHGFGMTKPPYPDRLPFYSVDSSYWSAGMRNGTVGLYDPAAHTFRRMRVGTRQVHARRMAALVRAYGGDPAQVATPGFGRVAERGAMGRTDREWMALAACESWHAYGADLRARHRPVPAPGPVRGTGPKVYLAVGDEGGFDQVVQAAAKAPATLKEASRG
ncbi:hypothetical protein [Actinomadura violacea]|uniref:Uncharacterized protein n=1 Tax=Actinomadura violacea TaxID=2819934 RepID=A0ABS3RXX7_9ACTN|nr:hypothetical protein [Actinomadura violacea]MBO2461595.1 hypothetical protein [Actinomadura violacea]